MKPETPYLRVDATKMRHNIERMARMAAERSVALRPHAKTHKIPELARLQMAAGARGITAAKVSEAEIMAGGGVDDIFIAYPLITEEKLGRALALAERCRVIFAADSVEGARLLSRAALDRSTTAEVRLEIDTGMRRTGVLPGEARRVAEQIDGMKGLRLTGLFTYRGSLIGGRPTLDRRSAGLEEGRLMSEIAEELRSHGLDIREVSVGSTPTAEFASQATAVTEIRPGTYIFNDRMQAAWGACALDDCALTVEVTVVSAPSPDRIVVDGGSKTFSTDAAPGAGPLNLRGYGEVEGAADLVLEHMSEEHGIIPVTGGRRFRIGERLRIIPNHVCTTVNLHDRLWIAEEPDGHLRELPIAARGSVS